MFLSLLFARGRLLSPQGHSVMPLPLHVTGACGTLGKACETSGLSDVLQGGVFLPYVMAFVC